MSKRPFFKNPAREQVTPKFKPYVPQYVVRGVEPEQRQIASATVPEAYAKTMRQPTPRSMTNPRLRPPPSVSKNVPYAELPPNEVISAGGLPNVGNNMETSWGPNEEFYDMDQTSVSSIPAHMLIDNNQHDDANYADIPEMVEAPPTERDLTVYDDDESEEEESTGDYILVVKDNIVSSFNSLKEIEEEVKALVFGEHPLCATNEIANDDIVVLKKMKIKVGVFLVD